MAITMARLTGGSVTNIESWANETLESANLKYIGDKPVAIGDTYLDGKYYHNGEEVLTPSEAKNQELEKENKALIEALDNAIEEIKEDGVVLDIITKGVDSVDES